MDAKQLASYPVSVRFNPPPSAKKIPMQYPGWCVFCDGSVDNNLWSSCQLMLDRTVWLQSVKGP